MLARAPLFLRSLTLSLVLLCLVGMARANPAQPLPAEGNGPLESLASDWVQRNLERQDGGDAPLPLRPEITVGRLDPRLRLAACQQVEPYLPKGARLWGRSRIGLRCLDGHANWNVFLPITVKVWGPAWTARRTIAPGEVLSENDAERAEVDWAEHPAPVIAQADDWVGAITARGLLPGQVLRQNMLRPVQVFKAGTEVKVVVSQARLNLAATGRAMGHGFLGQSVRVKMDSGKTVSGRVQKDSTVVIEML